MKNYPRICSRRNLGMACLLAIASAVPMLAQQAAAPAVPPTLTDEESIVLDPFSVTAQSQDDGYVVKDALGGNRVRTELKDIGSALSVYNEQFLKDIGATNTETLLPYATNSEVGGVGGNFAGTGNGRELGETAQLARPNNNTRVRGLAAADNTRDFFLTEIPWDGYNIGRVDITRGANAILFGIGSPAGIINNSTNDASFKDSNKIEARIDGDGGFRAVGDFNKVILRNELAVRLSALNNQERFRQKEAFNRDERLYGALNYSPKFARKWGMSTNIKMRYEHGDIDANRPRSLTPVDQITPWFGPLNKMLVNPEVAWNGAEGGDDMMRFLRVNEKGGGVNPLYNPWLGDYAGMSGSAASTFDDYRVDSQSLVRTYERQNYWGLGNGTSITDSKLLARANANGYYGLSSVGTPGAWTGNAGVWDSTIEGLNFSRPVGISSYASWANAVPNSSGGQGGEYKLIGGYKDRHISDSGVFDFWNHLLDGPNKKEWRGFDAYNIQLAQTFLNDRVGLQAAYDRQKYHDGQINGLRNTLYIDLNSHLMEGVANPNAGRALVRNDGGVREYESDSEVFRATLYGEFRFDDIMERGWLSRMLGRHVFTGMYADEEKSTRSVNYTQYVMDSDYAYFVKGREAGDQQIDSGMRALRVISYVSGDLTGVSDASGVNAQALQALRTPDLSKGVYLFDSHWAMPTDPTASGYVNPADPWENLRTSNAAFQNQAENPANYRGWTYNPAKMLSYANGDEPITGGLKTYRRVKTEAAIWQAYLLDESLVPTVGWRRDRYAGGNAQRTVGNLTDKNDPTWTVAAPTYESDESFSYSIVAHSRKLLKNKLPFGTHFSFFYNYSENFQPRPGDKDMFNQDLANPMGETKDYGIVINTLDDKLSLRVNWYNTKVANDRLSGFEFWRIPGLFSSWLAAGTRVRDKDPGATWKWDYSSWTDFGGQAQADAGAQQIVDLYGTNTVFKNFVDGWGMTKYMTQEGSMWSVPAGVTATTDSESKGVEFEISAKPVSGLNLSFNASKTSALQQNIGGALKEWVETMDPLFAGSAGDLRQWWAGDANNFRTLWKAEIMSQFNRLKALESTDVSELRPWRFNLVGTYSFQSGRFKGGFIGGGYRWEDKVVIGHATKVVRNVDTGVDDLVYDVDSPYYGPSENHVDLWMGYSFKVTKKVDWKIQLNVRDLFADKKLVPISVQPDGSAAAFRIPGTTSWSLTNTFSF